MTDSHHQRENDLGENRLVTPEHQLIRNQPSTDSASTKSHEADLHLSEDAPGLEEILGFNFDFDQ